ncbi:MAG: response regulator transcription factor [Cyclobacteriaceae bacterium]
MRGIDVCIVDDHNLFRKAMVRLVGGFSRVNEVSEAQHGKELLSVLGRKSPHVILLDLEMPVMNGVETAEQIIPKFPEVKVVVLTQHDSEKFMLHMLELGVHTFLLKNSNPEELEKAIYAVYDNDFYNNDLVSSVMRRSMALKSERPVFSRLAELTEREKEIFELICSEMSLKEIGQKLSISEKTIHTHKANVQAKLGVKNTVGMIKFAYHNGILS